MLRTIHRPLGYLAFGLAACAVVPWTGAVSAQPAGTKARANFLPYQPPGPMRPTQGQNVQGLFGLGGGLGGGGLGGGGLGGGGQIGRAHV